MFDPQVLFDPFELNDWATYCPSEATIRYRFHPLRGSSLPVIRRHFVHEEPCYVVRRPNGLPLSVPVWMSQLTAGTIEIVREPRLALSALLELRRLATTYLSSLTFTDAEGSHDAAARGKTAIWRKKACVYIRQSTPGQVQNNLESQRLQSALVLVDRARQLGWADVGVIDDDLGCPASDIHRPGFERMLGAICEGKVGAIFRIEASRLARTGRDWHTLLEFCGVVGVLLIDADGI
jgi:hypothetical protein